MSEIVELLLHAIGAAIGSLVGFYLGWYVIAPAWRWITRG